MDSDLLLDTRPSECGWSRLKPPELSSQTSSMASVFFHHQLQRLIHSDPRNRAGLRIATSLTLAHVSRPYGFHRGNPRAVRRGQSGRRHGNRDRRTHAFWHSSYRVFMQIRLKDRKRWETVLPHPRHHVNDDIWYVLLRAVCASHLDVWEKLPMISYCATMGPPVVKEASVRALGDTGGQVASDLIRWVGESDSSPMVRETVAEVLDDLGE